MAELVAAGVERGLANGWLPTRHGTRRRGRQGPIEVHHEGREIAGGGGRIELICDSASPRTCTEAGGHDHMVCALGCATVRGPPPRQAATRGFLQWIGCRGQAALVAERAEELGAELPRAAAAACGPRAARRVGSDGDEGVLVWSAGARHVEGLGKAGPPLDERHGGIGGVRGVRDDDSDGEALVDQPHGEQAGGGGHDLDAGRGCGPATAARCADEGMRARQPQLQASNPTIGRSRDDGVLGDL